jgi:DNA-binding transcriptional MerR regulator
MAALLTIGEFSKLTHLSVKALRHYDDVGLLQPASVDAASSYRFYAAAQVPVAQVIRRFRDLDMPLDDIRTVLDAPDVAARDQAIVAHLQRMEDALQQTQATVASLRALLEGKEPSLPVAYRSVPLTRVLAVTDDVDWNETEPWLHGALDAIHSVLGSSRAGPDAALYSPEFFEAHRGPCTAYVPVSGDAGGGGRVAVTYVPAAELAVTLYQGDFAELDRAYGALGTFVAERKIGVDGPIRELYLDATSTEVCWPIRSIPKEETRP